MGTQASMVLSTHHKSFLDRHHVMAISRSYPKHLVKFFGKKTDLTPFFGSSLYFTGPNLVICLVIHPDIRQLYDASQSDYLVSFSYLMAIFSANLFGLFYVETFWETLSQLSFLPSSGFLLYHHWDSANSPSQISQHQNILGTCGSAKGCRKKIKCSMCFWGLS